MAIYCAKCNTKVGVIGRCPTCRRNEKKAATERIECATTANAGDEQDNVCQECGDHKPCGCE